jgi:multidrug efflux pump subunit AcrA (membrane-fusion protein)
MALWLLAPAVALAGCRSQVSKAADQEKEGAGAPTLAQVGDETVIVLDSSTVTRIGVSTVSLRRASSPPEVELAGVVIEDPGAATTIRTGIAGRLAEADGHSWPRVGDRLPAGIEIARVGDSRPLTVPRGGTVVRLLAQPGELVQPGQALLELTDYSNPVMRIAWSTDAPAPPPILTAALLGGRSRLTGRLEGPAPQADPLTAGAAYLYRLSGASGLARPGAAMVAFLPDRRVRGAGVEVPSSAVVQWEALAWTYVERAPGRFARVRVPTDHPFPGGWSVDEGLKPGDRVVVTGAGQLLSEEFRARIVVGEEVGE